MKTCVLLRRSLRAAVMLLALGWCAAASCGEIHEAAKKGDLEKVKALVSANHTLVSSKDDSGRTPLHWAAAGGYKELVQFLLDNKADPRAKDSNGETPLDLAAFHKDVADLLRLN